MTISTKSTDLNQGYELDKQAIADYNKNGHILLREVLTGTALDESRAAIEGVVAERSRDQIPIEQRDTYGKAFLQIMNLWRDDETVRRFTLARRFAGIARDLMNVRHVRLYHDQALFKEAGGGFTPWHQDEHYWPLDTDHTITMWLPLVDVSEEMGTLTFASGSHHEGYLGDQPISDDSEQHFAAYCDEKGYQIVHMPAMKAGDATFHTGWTLHAAPGNSTAQLRAVMTVIYFADGSYILTDGDPRWNDNRRSDLNSWLPGVSPGELAASELNPVLA